MNQPFRRKGGTGNETVSRPRLSWAEWLVLALSALLLGALIFGAAACFRLRGKAQVALVNAKAANLAAGAVAAERYALGRSFADQTRPDGFADGVQDSIVKLGALPGAVQLLQVDGTGYQVRSFAYREGSCLVLHDETGSWQVYSGRLQLAYSPD